MKTSRAGVSPSLRSGRRRPAGLRRKSRLDHSILYTAYANPLEDPIAVGVCGTVRCNNAVKDFIHVEIGPDGTPWVASVDGCSAECAAAGAGENDIREGAVGRLWGGPNLRD